MHFVGLSFTVRKMQGPNCKICNQSKKVCSDNGHVTFTTLNMVLYLAYLNDLDHNLLQEQIYCHRANCTTGITLLAVLNKSVKDTNNNWYNFVCHGYWVVEMVLVSVCHHLRNPNSHADVTGCRYCKSMAFRRLPTPYCSFQITVFSRQ
jgi:hypothetical protein